MNTEVIVKETRKSQDPDKALREIRDSAVMLTMAKEYICEDSFLKKTGENIKANIKIIENYIEYLKGQFVGKPIAEIDLSEPVKRLAEFAEHLEKVDDGLKGKCTDGELGKELEEKITSLAGEINALKDRVEGTSVSYTMKDSVIRFLARFKFIIRSLVVTSRFTVRIAALFVLVCLMIFLYLLVTMETERAPLKKVEESRARILSKQEAVVRIEAEIGPIQEEIERFQKDELTRKEEIKLLDLNLKAHKLTEKKQMALIDVKIAEKELEKKLKELEVVQQKSFLERLLKQ